MKEEENGPNSKIVIMRHSPLLEFLTQKVKSSI